MTRFVEGVTRDSRILVGNAGLSEAAKEAGYICTLCFAVGGEDSLTVVDLHLTHEQCEEIIDCLTDVLTRPSWRNER